MQRAFRILIGLKGGWVVGELVIPEAGLLIDHQPFQLIQQGSDAIGVVNPSLLPQGALELPGQHQGQEQKQDQGQQYRSNQDLPELMKIHREPPRPSGAFVCNMSFSFSTRVNAPSPLVAETLTTRITSSGRATYAESIRIGMSGLSLAQDGGYLTPVHARHGVIHDHCVDLLGIEER